MASFIWLRRSILRWCEFPNARARGIDNYKRRWYRLHGRCDDDDLEDEIKNPSDDSV
jgi:hypothetical protein